MPSVTAHLCSAQTLDGRHGYHPQVQEPSCYYVDHHYMLPICGCHSFCEPFLIIAQRQQ